VTDGDGVRPRESEYETTIRRNVRTHGWHVTAVAPRRETPPHERAPSFAYTVGVLTTLALPELIIFGLPPRLMGGLLGDLCQKLRNGERFEPGAPIGALLRDAFAQLHPEHPSHVPIYLRSACWFHRSADVPALQLFWPDRDGNLPWEPGAAASVRAAQPDLRRPAIAGP
jgi:hypothetical protein